MAEAAPRAILTGPRQRVLSGPRRRRLGAARRPWHVRGPGWQRRQQQGPRQPRCRLEGDSRVRGVEGASRLPDGRRQIPERDPTRGDVPQCSSGQGTQEQAVPGAPLDGPGRPEERDPVLADERRHPRRLDLSFLVQGEQPEPKPPRTPVVPALAGSVKPQESRAKPGHHHREQRLLAAAKQEGRRPARARAAGVSPIAAATGPAAEEAAKQGQGRRSGTGGRSEGAASG